jgi:uncharacterized protein with ATP-grasp and redox domains
MKRTPKSTRALPEPLRGRDPGTWQHFTVSQRLRAIAGRVVEENPALPSESADRLATLMAEIPDAPIRFLDDPRAPDAAAWRRYVRPYLGLDWYQPPWFFIEMYFFRRVLEAVGTFRRGPTRGLDPYRRQKLDGLAAAPAALARAAAWSMTADARADLMRLLAASAWGNQADMSIWPIGRESGPDGGHLVVDDCERIAAALVGGRGRIALLADNAGVELAADLALIDFLLESSLVESVELHVKPFPTFVSDATLPDVVETALSFAHRGELADVRALGQRLLGALACGQLAIRPHVYWTSPRPFWELPGDLRRTLGRCSLIISKGDANYRRLVGDRHWPYTAPFAAVLDGAPAPVAALRVVKAEVTVGLAEGQADVLAETDPDWQANGRWAMIQFSR